MRRIRTAGLLLLWIGCVGIALAEPAASAREAGPPTAAVLVGSGSLSSAAIRAHVDSLTRPEWNGRAPGSPGADSAAAYVETRFREAGLAPVRPGGSLRISTPLHSGVRIQGMVGLRDERHGYQFGRDYWPQGFTSDGEVLSTLVFAGYGITAEESGYDDYAGVDVQGRVVVVFGGAPGLSTGTTGLASDYPGWRATPYTKARVARDRGAAAILFLTPPVGAGPLDVLWAVPQERAYVDAGIPACHLSGAAGESLFRASGLHPRELQAEIDRALRPQSRELPGDSVQVLVSARRLEGAGVNLVAVLPGRSPETVVVASCYDGYGVMPAQPRPVVCPGATDNASGTAALLELARVLRDAPPLERTLCFVAFAGRDLEGVGFDAVLGESGLDRARITAVVELAALGRLRDNRLHATGGGESVERMVRRVNDLAPDRLDLEWTANAPGGTLPRRLADEGIPCLGFSTGDALDFGTPQDTPDRVDPAGEARACRLIYGVIRSLAGERM